MNLDVAGIDLLFAGDHYKVCEANSSSGFEGMEQCSAINIPGEIYHYIRIRPGIFEKKKKSETGNPEPPSFSRE